ncbi:tetratricopeptide repeat protein [Saccharopolyspora halophila]|uniref:Tetratricopeptide repeat protein n=1 Tax=Saccharopolyspora halophila TaxID=405551 RepID=A0ABP5TNG4_9PSEU
MAVEQRKVITARNVAFVVALALLVYLVLMGERAFTMIITGQPVFVVLGVAILVFPVLGALLVVDQLRFGAATERLARRLDDEGALPDVSHLPRRPSGRVERAAADEWFDAKQAELESEPEDWRRWFALAQAYDLAGDRNRGRKAMRKAIDMERAAG